VVPGALVGHHVHVTRAQPSPSEEIPSDELRPGEAGAAAPEEAEATRSQAELAVEERQEGRRLWAGIVTLVVLMAIVVGLVTALPGLDTVERRLADMAPGWIATAIALEWLSCVGYILAFQLVFSRAPRRFAARVALSELAFGAVVPIGGAGGVAVGAWMLRAKGVSWSLIARRSAALFLLTSAVNVVALVPAGIAFAIDGNVEHHVLLGTLPAAVGVVVIGLLWPLPRFRTRLEGDGRLRRLLRGSVDAIEDAKRHILHPHWRLIGVLMYLGCDIAVLGVCLHAVGVDLDPSALVLGYLIGYLGNLLPVPGGIGVLDGGLVAALALYGAPVAQTTAAVLVYHAIVLWLPTLIGSIAFVLARRTLHDPVAPRPAADDECASR
jgi:uncharacterized membrane protein YbhN (UPF0104 family)